jgi:hypothetical protein
MERKTAAPRDAYDMILHLWGQVPHGAKVVLLYQLVSSLTPTSLEEFREICEEQVLGWGYPWE